MKKKTVIFLCLLGAVTAVFLAVFPFIEIRQENRLIVCDYGFNIDEFEENPSYNELYFYNEKRDISISGFDSYNFLFFYVHCFEFIEGDARETQFILKEEYIDRWLCEAVLDEENADFDLHSLISGREAIVGNTRYLGNDYQNVVFFELDGRYDELSYFYTEDGLLIIQVGSPDESPRYIAYK